MFPSRKRWTPSCRPTSPVQVLDPADPYSIGAMVGPEAFTEVRYLAHDKQLQALQLIPEIASEFKEVFGRESGGLLHPYRTEGAETVVVALGSVNGTIKDVVDALRDEGAAVGSVSICSFRPFPLAELKATRWPAPKTSSWWRRASRPAWAASWPRTSAWRCRKRRVRFTP